MGPNVLILRSICREFHYVGQQQMAETYADQSVNQTCQSRTYQHAFVSGVRIAQLCHETLQAKIMNRAIVLVALPVI